jgi:enterochelin esterase-like enzyme
MKHLSVRDPDYTSGDHSKTNKTTNPSSLSDPVTLLPGYKFDHRSSKDHMRLGLPVFLLLANLGLTQTSSSPNTQSPAIHSLEQQVSSGQLTVIDEFWSRIANLHSPIVEADPADPTFSFVTFVWRGSNDTNNVVLISPLALVNFDDAVMGRLADTNVWFRTYRMRNDARMSYRFAVNDSLVPFDKEKKFFERMKSWKTDPENPHKFDMGDGILASVLELPGAPSDKWTRDSDPSTKGNVTKGEFHSALLHNKRPVWIYTPTNFDHRKNYPLLVTMDGESYTSLVPVPIILDNLIAAGAIPPVTAVLIGNGPDDAREHEMNCSRAWGESLVKEMLPWLRLQQGLRFQDENNVIIGDSLTGLAAACAAHDHPDAFPRVISQSGSYFRAPVGEEPEWLARHVAREPAIPVQFYLEIGLLETASIPSRDPSMLTANRHLRDVLLAKGNRVHYVEHFSGHEHVSWRATIADALIDMLNPK